MNTRLIHNTPGSKIFDMINVGMLGIFSVVAIIPFIYVIAGSFATEAEIAVRGFFLIPRIFSLDAYVYIFSSNTIIRALYNSIFITAGGTLVNMFFTVPMAYALSKRYIMGRKLIMNLVIFAMLFSGGMIPGYLLVRNLGLLNSYWALWLPAAISPFNLIVIKNFFQEMPIELEESARIDGASDFQVLFRIILPLSTAVIATFSLFYAVGHWNAFFSALIYLSDPKQWPLQVILRNLIIMASGTIAESGMLDPDFIPPPRQTVNMAVIVVATLPILVIYPFVQKHFVKGVLLGSVKG